MTIGILNIGTGNIGSVANALKFLQYPYELISQSKDLHNCKAIIVPGVAHFEYLMSKLREEGFIELLNEKVSSRKLFYLGICAGMQILSDYSSEGNTLGLGWIKGKVEEIPKKSTKGDIIKIPHIGWHRLKILNKSKIYSEIPNKMRAYFVHSFHYKVADKSCVSAEVFYGRNIVASVEQNNIFGVQFHLEKSGENGIQMIKNFVNLVHSRKS